MEYTKPMLASSFDDYKHRLTYPVIVQPKLDGMRMMATVSNGQAIIYSRALKPFPAFEYASQFIVDSVPGNCILDGELIGSSFTDTVSAGRRKYEDALDLEFHVFDVVQDAPAIDRLHWLQANLRQNVKVRLIDTAVSHGEKPVIAMAEVAWANGQEGVMVKTTTGLYRIGKRSTEVLKVKKHDTLDLPIVGMEEGEGKASGMLGALIVMNGTKHVKCGTGFTDEQRQDIWTNRDAMMGATAEVGYQEITAAGSLRHPTFVRIRIDK